MSDRRKNSSVRALFNRLHDSLRFRYMRNQLRIPESIDNRFKFRVATTQDELSAAYKILHESYLEKGYTKPNETGMRVVKYFALPTTTTLIALFDEKVVGTISIICRSTFGIPMESAFDISAVLDDNKFIAEISALAIDSRFREKRGALFLPLLKYFWEYTNIYMRLDAFVITVNPSMSDFYEGFFGFKRLKNSNVGSYSYANGHPGVGLWLDLHSAFGEWRNMYAGKPDSKSIYKYFTINPLSNFEFPNRDFYKSSDPVMTQKMLKYFFVEKSTVFKELTALEIMGLISCYPSKYLSGFFPDLQEKMERSDIRHRVNIQCNLGAGRSLSAMILDVSGSGVRLLSTQPISGMVHLNIPIAKNNCAKVVGVVKWAQNSVYGIQLLRTDSAWVQFCHYLHSDFDLLQDTEVTKAA